MGRRFAKKVYTGSTGNWTLASEKKFVYDGYKQIGEFDGSNTLQRSYIWQPGSVGQDVPLWVKDGANIYYYIVDGNKNVRAMVDNSGSVVAEYEYGPFGKIVVSSGAYKDTNPFRFSSEYFDSETGMTYYIFRYYSPELGRWLSRDPIQEKGGANLYAMVRNNVINLWDILGNYPYNVRFSPSAIEGFRTSVAPSVTASFSVPLSNSQFIIFGTNYAKSLPNLLYGYYISKAGDKLQAAMAQLAFTYAIGLSLAGENDCVGLMDDEWTNKNIFIPQVSLSDDDFASIVRGALNMALSTMEVVAGANPTSISIMTSEMINVTEIAPKIYFKWGCTDRETIAWQAKTYVGGHSLGSGTISGAFFNDFVKAICCSCFKSGTKNQRNPQKNWIYPRDPQITK